MLQRQFYVKGSLLFQGFSTLSTNCDRISAINNRFLSTFYKCSGTSDHRPVRWMEYGSISPITHQCFSTLPNDSDHDSCDDHTNNNNATSKDDSNRIPWFPKHRSEIDHIIHRTINATTTDSAVRGTNHDDDTVTSLSSDHPGFCDPIYRQRRTVLAQYAQQYQWDQNENIPIIAYTPSETNVWTMVYDQMVPLVQQHACREYQNEFQQMQRCGLYTRNQIPQQSHIYPYLYQKTQFRLRPVAGLLQSRDFLNALALRIFCSTQYIRHASQPYYTPEPDICHELLGHVPLLGNPVFADLSQQIGLASLGASDDDIVQLAKCYWHSVEFGLCYEQGNQKKAYGAGLLSSFGELEYACSEEKNQGDNDDVTNVDGPPVRPTYVPWDPKQASQQAFPITTYQPVYYVADSIMDALEKLKLFCDTHIETKKSYTVSYNPTTERIDVTMK